MCSKDTITIKQDLLLNSGVQKQHSRRDKNNSNIARYMRYINIQYDKENEGKSGSTRAMTGDY